MRFFIIFLTVLFASFPYCLLVPIVLAMLVAAFDVSPMTKLQLTRTVARIQGRRRILQSHVDPVLRLAHRIFFFLLWILAALRGCRMLLPDERIFTTQRLERGPGRSFWTCFALTLWRLLQATDTIMKGLEDAGFV